MLFDSPYQAVNIPETALPAFVLQRASKLGDKPALIDGPTGRSLTYQQLAHGVQAVASGLSARGLNKGDVFAIFSPNLPEYALAFHGVATAGGVVTTINPLSTTDELARQLSDSAARFLLTVPALLEVATSAAERAGVEEVFSFGDVEDVTSFADVLGDPTAAPKPDIDPRTDLVALPYSSGTTGLPKGVMLTHHNLVSNVCQAGVPMDAGEDDVVMGVLPFFHIYGMTVILNLALRSGATVITMPRFDLEQFLRLHQEHGITRSYVVPPIILALAKHPLVERFDLSSLDFVLSGAAPLGADLVEACATRLDCPVFQGYGLTETSPVTHVIPREPGRDRPGSIGPPIPNTQSKAADLDTGQDLPPGETGEICIRGPQVMRGYLGDERATEAMIDEQGWLHTGDLGYADEDGYFFVVDRVKELIKFKGFQVAPAELEALLLEHESIKDAAVIPHPDEEAGEIPKAYVVCDRDLTEAEVMAFVAGRVAPHKRVRAVTFVDEIPKSPSGKILRRVLIDADRG